MEHDTAFGVIPVHIPKQGPIQFLLVHQINGGHWSFPKGHAEVGESAEEAAERECTAAVGIDVILDEVHPLIDRYVTDRNGTPVDKTVVYFMGYCESAFPPVPGGAVDDAAWFPYDEARAHITFPTTRAVVERVHDFLVEPAAMPKEQFEGLVIEAIASVPPSVEAYLAAVSVLVEDEPSMDDRRYAGVPPTGTLLGLYKGVPQTARGPDYGVGPTLPDTITLYRLPILDQARDSGVSVADVIRDTLWHEIAHHVGLDEEAVAKRESEGTNEYR